MIRGVSFNRLMQSTRRDWVRRGGLDLGAEFPFTGLVPSERRTSLDSNRHDHSLRRSFRAPLRDGRAPENRVDLMWKALHACLKPSASQEAMRSFLWLWIRWDLIPTYAEMSK